MLGSGKSTRRVWMRLGMCKVKSYLKAFFSRGIFMEPQVAFSRKGFKCEY